MMRPRTEAGQALDAYELHDYDDKPIRITDAILAIEAEASTPPALDVHCASCDGHSCAVSTGDEP